MPTTIATIARDIETALSGNISSIEQEKIVNRFWAIDIEIAPELLENLIARVDQITANWN